MVKSFVTIKGIDRLLNVLDKDIADFDKTTTEALDEVGDMIVQKAKRYVRVRTGALRDSISAELKHELVVFVSMLFYGFYLEYGTVKMPPYPFIRPALQELKPHIGPTVWKHLNKLFHK